MKERVLFCGKGSVIHFLVMAFAFTTLDSVHGRLAAEPIPREQSAYLADYDAPTTKVRAGFVPYKAKVVLGEPLQVAFLVENIGTNDFKFEFGGDYRGTGRHDRFKITGTDAKGNALPDPITNDYDFGGILLPVSLKPGQRFTNVFELTSFRVIDKPGVYTIKCSFAFDERWAPKKIPANPTVSNSFKFEILGRTPERVAKVLDELVEKARAAHGKDVDETLAVLAHFGNDEAVPRLAELAKNGPMPLRVSAVGALSLIDTKASLEVLCGALKDADAPIRSAAAGSLGALHQERAVDALLGAFLTEKSPVKEAILVALGASKSGRAFPALTNALNTGSLELQRASIRALVNFGGSNGIAALEEHINTNFLFLRYEIARALGDDLRQPLKAEWLVPVLAGRERGPEWYDSLRMFRMYTGAGAVPAMLSCIDYEVAWSGRNWWILEQGVKYCSNSLAFNYEYDPNSDGTSGQWEANRRTLQKLKPLAWPSPALAPHTARTAALNTNTDPAIDFSPTFKEIERGGVEIKSGFLSLTLWHGGANFPYSPPERYKGTYECAERFRSLASHPERRAELKMGPQQEQKLEDLLRQFAVKLCGARISDQNRGNYYNLLANNHGFPSDADWSSLLVAYKEAPEGRVREEAKLELIGSVRALSQNYHEGTVEFAKDASNVFTAAQLKQMLPK